MDPITAFESCSKGHQKTTKLQWAKSYFRSQIAIRLSYSSWAQHQCSTKMKYPFPKSSKNWCSHSRSRNEDSHRFRMDYWWVIALVFFGHVLNNFLVLLWSLNLFLWAHYERKKVVKSMPASALELWVLSLINFFLFSEHSRPSIK